jgi:hypothetical protein
MSWIFPSLGEYEVDALIGGVVTRVDAFSTTPDKYAAHENLKMVGRGTHHKVVLNGREMPPISGEFFFWKGKPRKR